MNKIASNITLYKDALIFGSHADDDKQYMALLKESMEGIPETEWMEKNWDLGFGDLDSYVAGALPHRPLQDIQGDGFWLHLFRTMSCGFDLVRVVDKGGFPKGKWGLNNRDILLFELSNSGVQ